MATRRDNLKIIGAIGATCAFPFSADELYGQHIHAAEQKKPDKTEAYKPQFFSESQFALIARLTDLIIPPTDSPGAVDAGVPEYIDRLVSTNTSHQPHLSHGLDWIEQQSVELHHLAFLQLTDTQQLEILMPLSDALDEQEKSAVSVMGTVPASGTGRPQDKFQFDAIEFFRRLKYMTADGYYTSRAGLVEELGYPGNTALPAFPSCEIREH